VGRVYRRQSHGPGPPIHISLGTGEAAGVFFLGETTMRRLSLFLAVAVLIGAAPVAAQSRILPRGVVNAASFARPGLPNGAIARGSIFSIFGTRLGPENPAQANSFPLPDSLAGVSIEVIQGDTTVAAIPLFAIASQINAIMPSDAPLGPASIRVTSGVLRSNFAPIEIVDTNLGIFTATGLGIGPGILQNFVSQSIQPINSLAGPANPGQFVTLWATGLGPVEFPDNEAPVAGNLPVDVEIWVGGAPVPAEDMAYFGRTPCCAGVDQFVFPIPATAPLGCYVPVHARTGGELLSNTVTIAISEGDGPCEDRFAELQSPGVFGTLFLVRATFEQTIDVPAPFEATADLAAASFRGETGGGFFFNPTTSLPPEGTCTVYSGSGDVFGGAVLPNSASTTGVLADAGTMIRLQGPGGVRRLPVMPIDPLNYLAGLGGAFPGGAGRRYFAEGQYTITGSGGADVAAFETGVDFPGAIDWTNRDAVDVIDRRSDLELTWAALGPGSQVAILVGNHDAPTDSLGVVACVSAGATGAFDVPARVLSSLPASRNGAHQSQGGVLLWQLEPSPAKFDSQGLDQGWAISINAAGKSAVFE